VTPEPTRALYRNSDEFDATIDAAAEQLGISPTAVEKDYWVTEVLRSLTTNHRGDFIFKGGTSLSKAYLLVERFSEDVDLLVLPGERGRSATDKMMRRFAATAAEHVNGEARPAGSSETGRHRSFEIVYPTLRPATDLLSTSVLLEMGIRGGNHPYEVRPVGSLLADRLEGSGFPTDDYDDLRTVEVAVLHPMRTLLEKLVLIDRLTTELTEEPEREIPPRLCRHFYDIHALLGAPLILDRLAGRTEFETVVADITDVSARWFAGTGSLEQRPEGGFATGRAFRSGDEISARFQTSYDATMDELHFGNSPLPTWDQICDRVHQNADLL